MIKFVKKIVRSIRQWHYWRSYPSYITKQDIDSIISGERSLTQFFSRLPEPFLSFLEICNNFMLLSRGYTKSIGNFEGSPQETRLIECSKEMEMCVKNFDTILSRKMMDRVTEESTKYFVRRLRLDQLIHLVFSKITYADSGMKEWCLDTSDRIISCYAEMRSTLDATKDLSGHLEQMLYFAVIGYKIDRMKTVSSIIQTLGETHEISRQ